VILDMKKFTLNHAYGTVTPLTPEMKTKCKDTGGSFRILTDSIVLNIGFSACVHNTDYREGSENPPVVSRSFLEDAFSKTQGVFDSLSKAREVFVELIGENIEIQNRYGKPKIVKLLGVSNIYANDSVYSTHPFIQGANGIDHLFFEVRVTK
jgi:hypothetical protein